MEQKNPLLAATAVTKRYRDDMEKALPPVLRGVDLTIYAGASLSIMGASGAGKSTLLHILGTIDYPSSGHMYFKEEELSGQSDEALAQFRNQHLGFVFQFHHLLSEFTALENVMMPLLLRRTRTRSVREAAFQALDSVGLANKAGSLPGELSGGEQQRVAIARAIVGEPQLLLADEPTGNLDEATSERVMDLLFRLNQEQGLTLVYVTHHPGFAARAARQFEIRDGQLHERMLA